MMFFAPATRIATAMAIVLAAPATAFYGQITERTVCNSEGCGTVVGLVDYNTGSTYDSYTVYGCNVPYTSECATRFHETSPGGYDFDANFWITTDGCRNIEFFGLGGGHAYCCGGVPCDLWT